MLRLLFQYEVSLKDNLEKELVQVQDYTTNQKRYEFVSADELNGINSYRQKEAHVMKFFSKAKALKFCKEHNFNNVKII